MGTENNYRIRDDIPDCCGNCKNCLWNEEGPHCLIPLKSDPSLDIHDIYDNEMVDWNGCCDNHQRGEPRHDYP